MDNKEKTVTSRQLSGDLIEAGHSLLDTYRLSNFYKKIFEVLPFPIDAMIQVRGRGDNRIRIDFIYPELVKMYFFFEVGRGEMFLKKIESSHYDINIKWAFNHHPEASMNAGAARLIRVYEAGYLGI